MSSLQVDNIQTYNSNPPVIKNVSGTEVGTFCRAWVNFNGTNTVAIRGSSNVSSITDQGTGSYTINFTTAMPDVNYSLIATGGNVQLQYGAYALDDSQYRGRTTTACSVASYSASNNLDNQYMNIAIFR